MVAGPSQSGKTTLVETMIRMKEDLFTEPFSAVYWFCAHPPKDKIEGVQYRVGIPEKVEQTIEPHSLVILDDLMKELSNSALLTTLMTKTVHHLPITLIYITQNIFSAGADSKTRRLNTHYIFAFKNPHDRAQIGYLGREMRPECKEFLSNAYNDATSKHAYSYLMMDYRPETPDEVRVRTHITKTVQKVYVPPTMQLNL